MPSRICVVLTCYGHRREGGGLVHVEHAHNEEVGGLESMITMDTDFSEDESDVEVHLEPLA